MITKLRTKQPLEKRLKEIENNIDMVDEYTQYRADEVTKSRGI